MTNREWQIETFWDCESGHKHQLGRHLNCSICGRPKGKDVLYYLPDDPNHAPEVTDEKMLSDAKAGPNWSCRFCGCHERRNDGECKNCGVSQLAGDSENAKPVGVSTINVDDDQVKNVKIIAFYFHLGVFVLGLFLFAFIIWSLFPHAKHVHVSGVHWERTIDVEKNKIIHENGFQNPNDSFNVKFEGTRFHHTEHRRVGSHEEPYTEKVACGQTCEAVPRICTPIPKTCSTSCTSNKNGYATCRERCTGGGTSCSGGGTTCQTKFCDEKRTRTVDDYQDFPVDMPYYSWDVKRWVFDQKLVKSGDDLNVTWPETKLNEDQREGKRNEVFSVILMNKDGKTWDQNPKNETEFHQFVPGSEWVIMVDFLGNVHSISRK